MENLNYYYHKHTIEPYYMLQMISQESGTKKKLKIKLDQFVPCNEMSKTQYYHRLLSSQNKNSVENEIKNLTPKLSRQQT